MSLDVYLTLPSVRHEALYGDKKIPEIPRIFIRENGRRKEISREEWDRRYPDREPVFMTGQDPEEVYSGNITHNLAKMASEAGLFEALWYPPNSCKAKDLVHAMKIGLKTLLADPAKFNAMNPDWGNYDALVEFVQEYLDACEKYPEAEVSVSR